MGLITIKPPFGEFVYFVPTTQQASQRQVYTQTLGSSDFEKSGGIFSKAGLSECNKVLSAAGRDEWQQAVTMRRIRPSGQTMASANGREQGLRRFGGYTPEN